MQVNIIPWLTAFHKTGRSACPYRHKEKLNRVAKAVLVCRIYEQLLDVISCYLAVLLTID